MDLFTPQILEDIQAKILTHIRDQKFHKAVAGIGEVLNDLYQNIPDSKRISYGSVHTIKILAKKLNEELSHQSNYFDISIQLFEASNEGRTIGVALGMIASYGLNNLEEVLPFFIKAAANEDWELREHTQMFVKILIKKHPDVMQQKMLVWAKSEDPNIRRFVGEGLRPVQENKWFQKQPEYSLTVLEKLFQEHEVYPRTSVGNNLSDLSRQNPELILGIVKKLIASGNKDSNWIATRACRNLIKKYPLEVFEALQIDFYQYKNNKYHLSEYQ